MLTSQDEPPFGRPVGAPRLGTNLSIRFQLPNKPKKKKAPTDCKGLFLLELGRDGEIRTPGLCLPKAALYQAELHPERAQ